ncbi:MAG: metal ABC transporter ATP-binding protein [Thiotrichales bacterium]
MTVPLIEFRDVSFSYGGPTVLEHINLAVNAGEFLGIVGPNASGKSTLLKLLLGLLQPASGSVRIDGGAPRERRALLGYVPQYPAFSRDFPITVEQTVLLGRLGTGAWWGGYRAADRAVARAAMQQAEVEELAGRRLATLSGGQLQRVLLARALASEPRVLILDEPTANLDQRVESDIFERLKQLNERMTILVVSHDVAFISSYVNHVACLNRTLVCHPTESIDSAMMAQLYGHPVHHIDHQHAAHAH